VNETAADHRADRIAAFATGVGVGLITFMLTWTIAARITERMLDTPTSAYVAMVGALCAGAVVTILTGRRLSNTSRAQMS
jgi:cytochrome bd-type quinol oxidase subunit 2